MFFAGDKDEDNAKIMFFAGDKDEDNAKIMFFAGDSQTRTKIMRR